ncbi:MAG TPA: DUF2497 domain-containing protein [Acetobacteraceae bacterium]|jgi:hypothetical protein
MSASQTPSGGTSQASASPSSAVDPSMEDILASIRRILSEDEPGNAQATASLPVPDAGHVQAAGLAPNDVLVLDDSMLVTNSPQAEPAPAPVEAARVPALPAAAEAGPDESPANAGLVAPAAAAAAATSVGSLVRTLAAGRATQVHSGGPTIEDIVRQEIRPLLKEWLDTNLPPIVERLVRTEIERVVGRAVP